MYLFSISHFSWKDLANPHYTVYDTYIATGGSNLIRTSSLILPTSR